MTVATPAATKAPNPWWVAIVCGMASYLDSCAIVSSGAALVLYQHSVGITSDQIGILSGILTFGIAIGATVGGRLGDRFGRRPVFQVTMLLTIAGALCLVFGNSFPLLLVGMALLGLGTGADLPVSIATISEAARDHNRGALIGLSNILWQLGVLGAMGMSIVASSRGHFGGQLLFGQIAVVGIFVLIGRQTIPESTVWSDAEHDRMQGAESERAKRASLSDLFQAPYLKPLVALFLFYTLVNLGANTARMFGSYIWVNVIGKSVAYGSMVNLLVFGFAILMGFIFMRVVDTRLRNPMFYAAAACQILSYVLPATLGFHPWTMIVSGLLGAFGGAFAFEGIMKVWTMEKFPTLLRSTAQGNVVAGARFVAGLLAFVTPRLINAGPTRLFWGVAVVVAIGYLAAIWGLARNNRNAFEEETLPADEVAAALS